MAQTGDPTGTGSGGESAWGAPFADEISQKMHHEGRGVPSRSPHSSRTAVHLANEASSSIQVAAVPVDQCYQSGQFDGAMASVSRGMSDLRVDMHRAAARGGLRLHPLPHVQ